MIDSRIMSAFSDEIEKTAKMTEEQKKKLKRGLTIGAATGLAVGAAKGVGEKAIEKRLARRFRPGSKIPWAAARGVTSAGAGMLYTVGTLAALGAFSRKKKKKEKK